MSNKDDSIAHNLCDKDTLVNEEKMDDIMNNLHQVLKVTNWLNYLIS